MCIHGWEYLGLSRKFMWNQTGSYAGKEVYKEIEFKLKTLLLWQPERRQEHRWIERGTMVGKSFRALLGLSKWGCTWTWVGHHVSSPSGTVFTPVNSEMVMGEPEMKGLSFFCLLERNSQEKCSGHWGRHGGEAGSAHFCLEVPKNSELELDGAGTVA